MIEEEDRARGADALQGAEQPSPRWRRLRTSVILGPRPVRPGAPLQPASRPEPAAPELPVASRPPGDAPVSVRARSRAVYLRPRVLVMLPLGFASGLPLLLTSDTLGTWLANAGVDVAKIGALALVSLPYQFKFLWSPLMDRFAPFSRGVLGRRRGWMLLLQVVLALAIAALGLFDPSRGVMPMAVAALVVAFLSASHDIVSDAYRADVLADDERGAGTAVFIAGYRIAMAVAGGLALALTSRWAWSAVYAAMGGLMLVGPLATAIAPSPPRTAPLRSFAEAAIEPFRAVLRRRGAWLALTFVALYAAGDQIARRMLGPFLVTHGYTNLEVGAVTKLWGIAATMAGAFLGGALLSKLKLRTALMVFGVALSVSVLGLYVLSVSPKSLSLLAAAISLEYGCSGMADAALVTFLMGLCDRKYSATQFALLSGLATLGRSAIASVSGAYIDAVGWPAFFVSCAALMLVALAVLWRIPEGLAQSPDHLPTR